MPSADELVTPYEVEREMVELNHRIDKAPLVVKEHHNKLRQARLQYKKSWSVAFNSVDGTQMDRKVHADLETLDKQAELDQAEVEYRYVTDLLDTYKTKLRALQSISSLLKAQMFQGNAS